MSKSTMMVCPHDTIHEPDRWYRLEQYLVRKLGVEIMFELSIDFQDFHDNLSKANMAYLNPVDCLKMRANHGFIPLVRPADRYDEAVFVTSPDMSGPTLAAIQGATLATVPNQMPTQIALHILKEQGVAPADIHYKDSWQSVISEVWNGASNFGIVYKDTYDNLSDQGKSLIQMFHTSNERQAFHCFSVGPNLADRKDEIANVLGSMDADSEGKEVLSELALTQWVPITPEELATMEALMSQAT